MGSHVREPEVIAPPRYVLNTCPHCGNERRVVNGAWLRWRREKAGLDQRTFASKLGVSGPYISDLERNRRECPTSIAKAYSKLPR
jgi:DNA-binding transcriptional regulator YiaG